MMCFADGQRLAGPLSSGVGGALVGGQGVGRGWGMERAVGACGIEGGGGLWAWVFRCIGAMRPPVRYSRLQCSACCGKVMLSHGGAKGMMTVLVKYQGRCITDWVDELLC